MAGLWFRVYDEALDDPRLQRLPASLFRAWFNVLCVASRNGGVLPELADLAWMLRTRAAPLSRRLDALKAAGLLDETDGQLRPVEWEKRQFVRQDAQDGQEPLSPAERTRRWREKLARDAGNVTACDVRDVTVTPIEEKQKEEDSHTAPAARASDDFEKFFEWFPKRDGDNPEGPARAAWSKALGKGADSALLIVGAKAYAATVAGREPKYIASAARWLGEERWRGAAPPKGAPGVWIKQGSPEWVPWSDHWRATKGKSPPVDAKGGWRFPSRIPPAPLEQAA